MRMRVNESKGPSALVFLEKKRGYIVTVPQASSKINKDFYFLFHWWHDMKV